MKKSLLNLIVVLLSPLAVLATEPPVTVFAFGGIGYPPVTPSGETRLQEILRSEDPEGGFENWFEHGNPQEKLYALTGLYYLDRERYLRLRTELDGQELEAEAMYGCSGVVDDIGVFVEQIESGWYSRGFERNLEEALEAIDEEVFRWSELLGSHDRGRNRLDLSSGWDA